MGLIKIIMKSKHQLIYNDLSQKIGYVNHEQMQMNEDEISNQTKVLFNLLCCMKKVPVFFLSYKEIPNT
tara:strand:+ start:4005 stop:4211 length:207 start_codon:yes stop_codon:yes gene_type:complete